MLYTHNGSTPAPLPFRITLSDGRARTDPATFTPEEIADAGYVAANPKPTPGADQVVSWGGSDWVVRTKTAEELAAEAAAEQAAAMAAGKAECRRRILAVADETAQINLAAAAGASLMTDQQRAVFVAGVQWIGQMRAAWPALVASGSDLSDDANWPAVPAGAAELAAAF
jgi:hypothetical protein